MVYKGWTRKKSLNTIYPIVKSSAINLRIIGLLIILIQSGAAAVED